MRYKAGDTSISARDFNRVLEAAEAWHRTKALGDARNIPASGSSDSGGGVLIKIKNETGVNLRVGEVVELKGYALADDYVVNGGYRWFRAKLVSNYCAYGPVLPLGPLQARPIAFCREAIPAESMGLAQIGGLCPVLIDVQSTDDQCGYLEAGKRVLKGQGYWGQAVMVRFPESQLQTGEQLLLCSVWGHGGWAGDAQHEDLIWPPTD